MKNRIEMGNNNWFPLRAMEPRRSDTRSSVLGRVRNPDDHDSWQTFFRIYGPFVKNQVIRAGLSDDDAQDITQETFIEVSKRIQTFEYDRSRGSFKGWLSKLTRWRITNHFQRKRHSFVSIESLPASTENHGDLQNSRLFTENWEESWEQEWRQTLFQAALNKLRDSISPRNFQVFDCLVVKQWTIDQVAETLKINRAQIYLIKLRVTSAIRKEVERLEKHGI